MIWRNCVRLVNKKYIFSFYARQSATFVNQLTIKDMPHSASLPFFGSKFNFMLTSTGTRLHEYIDRRHTQLGPIFRESLGGSCELVFTSDPELMRLLFIKLEGKYPAHILPEPWLLYEKLYGSKRGLLFMDGEEWLTNRRLLNKYLLKENAETWLVNPIIQTVTSFVNKWKMEAERCAFSPDLETEFYNLSTNVIINVLFGDKTTLKVSKHYQELLDRFSEAVKNIFLTTTKLYGIPVQWFHWLNLKQWREFKDSVDLSLLLAQKILNDMLNMGDKSNGLLMKLQQEQMSREMIIRIGADFIIAAGDTSTYTTLWILLLISSNYATVEEIRAKGQTFTRNVLKETMRLYPVAPFLTRILAKESTLGQYRLEPNTPIIASVYTSGRDEANYSRASEFLPYRWDRADPRREVLRNHVPSASMPFALGSRSCIGKKIAMLQLTEMITQIANNFDLKCVNSTEIKPVMSQVLVPNKRIKLKVSLRNKNIP